MSGEQQARPKNEGRTESDARPKYEAPKVTPMSEKDVLKSFQVTSAASTWWGM